MFIFAVIKPTCTKDDTFQQKFFSKSLSDDMEKDTSEKLLQKVTFEPKIQGFEDEIMEIMKIKEDRKRAPTFWY